MAKDIGQQTVTTTTSYSKNPNMKVLHSAGGFLEVSAQLLSGRVQIDRGQHLADRFRADVGGEGVSAGGSTVVYEPLLKRLPPDTPMYGLERVEGSIPERAAQYVPKLMEIGAGTSEIRRMLIGRELMAAQ